MDEDNERKYDLEDYLSYRELLNNSMEQADQKNRMFYNDSYVHAAMVAESIIRLATRGRMPIKMYCGEFSIFRDKYGEKINQLRVEMEPHDNPELHEKWTSFNPYRDLMNSFEAYLNNDEADFQLIVERDISGIKNEQVWAIVERGINNKKFSIKRITDSCGLSHFIVSGNSYRKESSDKEKTAICCFEDAVTAQILDANFNVLQGKAVKCFSV